MRERRVTPHIGLNGAVCKINKSRKIAIDGRTTGHTGCEISQRCRKRIEEPFRWIKVQARKRPQEHKSQTAKISHGMMHHATYAATR